MDSLLTKILTFRLRQLWRLFGHVGFIRIFLLAIVVSYTIFKGLNVISQNGYLAVLVYPLIILPIHLLRKDQYFIRKLAISKEAIFAVEYHALVLPYSFSLVYLQHWSAIFLGHLLITIIMFFPSINREKKHRNSSRFTKWIPVKLFEWRSHFRQQKVFLVICFTIASLFSNYAMAIPIVILILVASFSEAFTHLEPKELIEAYPRGSGFLWSKLKEHSVFIHSIFSPLYVLFLLFHPQLWYILVLLLIIIECSICFFLLYKYSWFGVSKSEIHNQVPFIIFFISTVLFFPIGIAFLFFYWQKAAKALPDYVKN